ncbi:MAG: DUF4097 family beta strand repeat-containing protein [Candidatus Cloacimonetes bacterium]|nr:DUF4097 family beta strand repeat-containing protein [Candidatus Cloacimonadota bacterium]
MTFIRKRLFETQPELTLKGSIVNVAVDITSYEGDKTTAELRITPRLNPEGEDIYLDEAIDNCYKLDYDSENNLLEIDLDLDDILEHLEETTDLKKSRRIKEALLLLTVPHKCSIELDNENSSIKVSDLIGNHIIGTDNGRIEVNRNQGKLDLDSENGRIIVKSQEGNLTAKTENGRIEISEVSGKEIELITENGSIQSRSADYSNGTITTENGAIYYEFLSIDKGEFNFETENGRITLIIPEEIPIDLSAETENGRIRIDLPEAEGVSNISSGRKAALKRGSGEVAISVRTENGAIVVAREKTEAGGELHNFDQSEILDFIKKKAEQLNIQIDLDTVADGLEKVKESLLKLKDIDVSNIVDKVKKEIKITLAKDFNKEKINGFKEDMEGIYGKISESVEKFKDKKKDSYTTEVKEQSRLKILKMLEEGKISAEEAEKLLKAIE